MIGELLDFALYPLILGFLGGFAAGFLLRRLGRVVAAVVAIGVFILNTIPLLRLMGIQPNIEWLKRLEELLPTPPLEALEDLRLIYPSSSAPPSSSASSPA